MRLLEAQSASTAGEHLLDDLMFLTRAAITLLFVLCSSCDIVYFSALSPEEAQEQGRVNLTELYPNETPNRISYSGYITINETLTNGDDINYFIWFVEAKNRYVGFLARNIFVT